MSSDGTGLARFRAGRSRQMTSYNLATGQKTIALPPGKRTTIAEAEGAGIIGRLWVTFPGWFWQHWNTGAVVDAQVLRKLTLRVYWDGEEKPSIEAPLGDFFGVGHCEYRHYTSLYLGMSSGGFYSYFPMPFANGCRFEVENEDTREDLNIFVNINYQELPELPDDLGRFHAQFQCSENRTGEFVEVLQAKGQGHFVGCTMSVQGPQANYLGFLEGPERIWIDGEDSPSIYGTGTEDYFNGGWYFREGEFAGPYHGVPLKDALRSMITMYRFHDTDAIGFEKSLRVAFVHGFQNDSPPSKYSTVAYWYQSEPHGAFEAFPSLAQRLDLHRIRDVDHASIP
jgi:hypothetical protein